MASRRTYDNYLSGCSQIESAIKSPFPLVRSGHAMPSRGVVRQYNISRRSKSFKTLWDFHWYFTQYMSWSIKGRVGKIFFIENCVYFYAFNIKYSVFKIKIKRVPSIHGNPSFLTLPLSHFKTCKNLIWYTPISLMHSSETEIIRKLLDFTRSGWMDWGGSVENQVATVGTQCGSVSKAFWMRDFTDICMKIFCASNRNRLYFKFGLLYQIFKVFGNKVSSKNPPLFTFEFFQLVKKGI